MMKRIELSPNGTKIVKEAFQNLSLTELKYMCVEPFQGQYQVGFSVVAGNRIILKDGSDTITVDAEKMAKLLFELLN